MNRKKTQLASRIDRWLASFIDGLVLLVILPFILLTAVTDSSFWIAIGYLAIFAISLGQIYIVSTTGQTIGKRLMKIKIVKRDTGLNGGFVTNVLLRSLVGIVLLSAIPFYSLIDILFIFRDDKRCIHDIISGTIVVDV